MNQPNERTLDERVLVLAPTAGDAALSRTFLTEAGFACLVCSDLCGLGREFEQGAGALLLTEEVLADSDSHCLVDALRQQPKWSDVPILLLTGDGADSPVAVWAMEMLGNVTLLERPVRVTILVSALRTALKARRRQYELRNQVEALRESEERFRLMADSIQQLAWMARPDGHIYWYNRRWYAYTGTTLEQMEGWGWQNVHDPTVLPKVLERWRASLCRGEPFDMVYPLKGKDGVFRPFLTRVMPVRDDEGRVARWFGTNTDISEQKRAEEELRDARSRLESTLAAGEVGTWEFDVVHNIVQADPNLARMFGVTPGESANGPLEAYTKAIHPDDRDRVTEAIGRALEAGEPFEAEYRIVRPDGAVRWVVARGRVERDVAGRAVRLPGVVVDITAQRQAEERERLLLAEAATANAKFRAFFEQGALFAGIMDLDGTIIEPNRLSWEGCGYTREQIIGKPFWEGPWWTPSAALVERIKAASAQAAAGQTFRAEIPYFVADGSERVADVIILPIKDEAGRVVFLAPTGTDITDRKKAEKELARLTQESEYRRRLYETTLSNSADFNYVFDLQGRFLYVNKPLLALWQRELSEAVGKNFFDLGYPPDLARRLQRQIQQVIDTRQPVRDETPYTSALGEREYEYIFVPVLAADGAVEAVAGSTRDVTERKALEKTLREQAEQLREADRRKDEFLATLAHELRNPLAPIRNGLQVLRLAGNNGQAVEQAHSMMERQLGQIVRLVDDLLDVSRITRNKLELRKERVELSAVVSSAVETSRPLIEASDHELMVTLPPSPIYLEADITRLAQVFLNLLNNAAKYTERGGHIRLTAERQGNEVVVAVKDDGIGIRPDMLPKVFEMFTQAERALDRAQGGLGIGLSLVKRLVEMHGGTVEAQSEGLGQGSVFVVRLPATTEQPKKPHRADVEEQAVRKSAHRILIADDNKDSADSLGMLLQVMGNDIRIVYDGQAAIETAGEFRPGVVLLDIGMPKLNGLEAARRLRQQEWGKGMVLIALTGWGQEQDIRRSREAGFDQHMVKPVDFAALEKLLAEIE